MNLRIGRFVTVLSCFACIALVGISIGADKNQDQASHALPARQNQELLDLLRTTQQLAEQSQAELKRSREQSENLQRLVEQTHQELIQLKEELSQLRLSMRAAQSNALLAVSSEKELQEKNKESRGLSTPTDSGNESAARLARIEDQVEINTAQIKEYAQTKVESESRFKVRLFGMVLNNTYFNTSDDSEEAVPTAAPPALAASQSGRANLGSTLRQTQLGFSMAGPKIGDFRLSADVDFDFFGGVGTDYKSNVLGALRMRTASARLNGFQTSFAIGLMTPMISPLNPTSLAAVYYPALGDSGNLWQWRPQMIMERRASVNKSVDLILQGGLLMPFGESVDGRALKGRLGYESRIAFAHGSDSQRRMEIGVGGYFYPQDFGFRRRVNSYAATSDWLIPLTNRLELSGEAFYGQSISLSDPGGANIADLFAITGPVDDAKTTVRGIHSFGGWTQLSARTTPKLEFNAAFGVDDPRNRDIFFGLFENTRRLANRTFSVNSMYRIRSNFLFSVEYRRLSTTYPDVRTTNNHFNLAIGYLF